MIRNISSLPVLLFGMLLLALAACEEDLEALAVQDEDSTVVAVVVPPPTLTLQNTNIATLIKFDVAVEANQVQDTAYYLVLAADADTLSAAALMSRTDTTALPMKGNRTRTGFQTNLEEGRDYVVYAVMKQGEYLSEVASLAVTAGATE